MRLQIQIDKPINQSLLLEQLQSLVTEIAMHDGYREVVSNDPASVLHVYQTPDHTQTGQAEQLPGERQAEAR
jgi:hypothetical protein